MLVEADCFFPFFPQQLCSHHKALADEGKELLGDVCFRPLVHNESVQETSRVCVDPLCASRFRMKLKAIFKQIPEALGEQIVKAVYFPYLKSFP